MTGHYTYPRKELSMEEVWVRVNGFPLYKINNFGEILNDDNGRRLKTSLTAQGAVKVGLVQNGQQVTRSVKVLVAEHFVEGQSDQFNTPIQLDGDQLNCCADNLVWRPRWFAWKYTKQFNTLYEYRNSGHIIDATTGRVYTDVVDVVLVNGLILTDIWKGIRNYESVFPTNQIFEVAR